MTVNNKLFKIDDIVKVIKKVNYWNGPHGSWVGSMNFTLYKEFIVLNIYEYDIQLNTTSCNGKIPIEFDYWYPPEALSNIKGMQREFMFMENNLENII